MIGTALLAVVAIYLLLCFGWGAIRSLVKARTRMILLLISAALAVAGCLMIKQSIPAPAEIIQAFETEVIPTLQTSVDAETFEQITGAIEYAKLSETLLELVSQLVIALVLPVLCFTSYIILSILTWILYLIITLIFGRSMKERSRAAALGRLRGGVWGLVSGLLSVIMLLVPICCYVDFAVPAIEDLIDEGVIDGKDENITMVVEEAKALQDSPVLSIYRTLGGGMLNDALMNITVAEETFAPEDEVASLIKLWGHIAPLTEKDMKEYGPSEAAAILAISDSFSDSKLLAPILGDVIGAATDSWLEGEAFLGMEKPAMGELFDPFLDELWSILNSDAKNATALKNDVKTVAELLSVLAENGIFANLENTEALLQSFTGDGVVKAMVKALGDNASMKRLIPQITNLGIRAVGQTLQIPENAEAVYGGFMETVAAALNEVSSMDEAARIPVLTEKLGNAFDNAGVDVEKDLLDFYSSSLIHDLVENNPAETVTAADVQAFFALYAEYAVSESEQPAVQNSTEALGAEQNADPFKGTIYENMTPEQRAKTAAGVLANVCKQLSNLSEETEDFAQAAQVIVTEAFSEILEEGSAALAVIQSVVIEAPVNTETITNTASLQSAEQMNSSVVTLDTLLLDVQEAAEKITGETIDLEANAISSIFEAAGSILGSMGSEGGSMENMNLGEIAGSLGTILDSLSDTGTFGEEKTAGLLTAVLQSETVRDAAQLDMKTATDLANKATANGGDYSNTMGVVAGSVGIMESLNKGEALTEDKIIELIRTLNPQTAGMIEVYVTEARLIGFGLPKDYAGVTAKFITSMFGYMGREDLANYEGEAKALNQILNLALSAKDGEGDKIFSSEGQNDGRLPTAKVTVSTLLDAHAIQYAVIQTFTKDGEVIVADPFGIAGKIPTDSQEYQDCVDAIYDYRENHPAEPGTENPDLIYEALAAIFGVTLELN
ncbi:MAG: hypothetical protein IIX80_00625 [Clostridia bacterium]|nr:hypothetical protein [Clostridia bacterium]